MPRRLSWCVWGWGGGGGNSPTVQPGETRRRTEWVPWWVCAIMCMLGFAAAQEVDDSVYAVSAWNDNGFADIVGDPYSLRRTSYFPGLGWLLTRKLYYEDVRAVTGRGDAVQGTESGEGTPWVQWHGSRCCRGMVITSHCPRRCSLSTPLHTHMVHVVNTHRPAPRTRCHSAPGTALLCAV